MANPIIGEELQRLLDGRLTKVYEDNLKQLHEIEHMVPMLFNIQSTTKAWEEYYEVGELSDIQPFTGKLEYANISPGYWTKIEPKQLALGVIIDRKFLDTKQYPVLDNFAKKLAGSSHRKEEKEGAEIFNNAFSAGYTYMQSEEGLSLCNSAHLTKSGVSTSSGFSNYHTTAMNKTTVAARWIIMRRFKNPIGERVIINPDMLLVPDTIGDSAEELTGTPHGLDSAYGNKNVQAGRFKVVRYKYLDDNDTNNWFMVDSRLMKEYLIWINGVKDEVNNTIDFDSFAIKHSIYRTMGCGFTNWRWIDGGQVS